MDMKNNTDPDEGVLEVEKSLVSHFVGEIPNDCNKPVVYVIQRDGLWERRRNDLGIFTHCVAPAHVPGLPTVLRQGFDLDIPRMPTSILWEAIAFFREIYFRMGTESMVRVIYDAHAGRYSTECPIQTVTPTSISFARRRLPPHQVVVADIHSHAGMKAGFSSVDDADEIADRFYGVIGDLDSAIPQISFRIAMGGEHMRVPLGSLFDLDRDPIFSCSFPQEWMDCVTQKKRRLRRPNPKTQLELLASFHAEDPDLSSDLFDDPEEAWPEQDGEILDDVAHLWCPPDDEDEVV